MTNTKTLEFRFTTSRGRETYGYTICSLYVDGRKVAACNGGGYDMSGTSLGNWVAYAYADRLRALTVDQMESHRHWQRAENPRVMCKDAECVIKNIKEKGDEYMFPPGTEKCPHCGGSTRTDTQDGKMIEDGRYFYGLTFHDPNYDPSKAVIGVDGNDRTLGKGAEGKTVGDAEGAGESFGLERYQAFYSASSKAPTERHTVPRIDGGCGFRSVETIMEAIGLKLEYVPSRSKRQTIYRLRDTKAST